MSKKLNRELLSWRIEIKKETPDPEAQALMHDILDLGIKSIKSVEIIRIYFIQGLKRLNDVRKITEELLGDPVTESCRIGRFRSQRKKEIEIIFNPGVMDPSAENIIGALAAMGFLNCQVKTGKRFLFPCRAKQEDIEKVTNSLLYNPLIQHPAQKGEKIFIKPAPFQFSINELPIIGKSDEELIEISRTRQLALNLKEMHTLKDYYTRLGRNPTDIELETFAQTWSEHCKHKTFTGNIIYNGRKIENLLKSTIFRVTKELNHPICLSVFKDNSGVIEFDSKYAVTFKVETHNHPSALEPYGGAATGIGGVIRDCLGTGLGAKPILNTDVFCFAAPDFAQEKIPKGILAPRRVLKGVVSGVRDYGNRMGIPTANGAIYFHDKFLGNPLVYCGTVGIMPKDKIEKKIEPGDLIVLIGGRTGRDGIHGVTFASLELTEQSEKISSTSVQIGNPIEEKKVTDVILEARDQNLFNAITDCGGGGLSSAVGELASSCGAQVQLEKVPLKYPGLSYTEIWISEAQERMILFVPKEKLKAFLGLCKDHDVEATVIGFLTNDKKLNLRYQGKTVGKIDLEFLHHGWPKIEKKATWSKPANPEPEIPLPKDLTKTLLKLLSSINIASKEWVIRQYDHEVQARTSVKPLLGSKNEGPSDACVLQPIRNDERGIVVSCGINPRYGLIDPYWMAASVIDEALRNLVAVGGDITKTALLDNFCWANPDRPEVLGGLVRASEASYEIAKEYGTPFISGKDSLYNEFTKDDGTIIPVPPTLLISAIGVIDDIEKTVTMDLKQTDSLIYLLGLTYEELGGSEYYALYDYLGNDLPKVDPKIGKELMKRLQSVIKKGLVNAVHDLSEGGLGVAIAEMAFAGGIGVEIDLSSVCLGKTNLRNDYILFSESNTRFLCEVSRTKKREFEKMFDGLPFSPIGKTISGNRLKIFDKNGRKIIDAELDLLKKTWKTALTKKL
ncbi:MAG: phosphoribosylformylglycinamidine synthase subunit PurL [candidate division WOR-3 bacterium]|nr:phosphoribosylformylglycinamidine synthase subunit PurL [candidate division WOR-3 bacterium]MDH5683700.1 phosphoribosylformylglycinamidine synthase subunit PurL [candidate division WOR-3 bacterium]